MFDDAISSLRTLFSASLLVLILWILSWSTFSEKLRLYSAAVEVQAWVQLREQLAAIEQEVFEGETNATISEVTTWVRRVAPNEEEYPVPEPLVVNVTWPELRPYAISLVPEETDLPREARAYRITGDGDSFPWSGYYALFLKETEFVIEGEEEVEREKTIVGVAPIDQPAFRVGKTGSRQIRAAIRDGNRPKRWEEVKLHLNRYGFDGAPEKLFSRDAALARLQEETDPRLPSGGVQIFGAQLTVAQFFFAVGILLAAISFAMIGPLLVLRFSHERKHSQSWVLVAPRSTGKMRGALDGAIFAATVLWAASPLIILLLQVKSYAGVTGVAGWAFRLGTVGIVVSSITYSLAAWELRAVRLHHRR